MEERRDILEERCVRCGGLLCYFDGVSAKRNFVFVDGLYVCKSCIYGIKNLGG
jgi:hypothetical protein